jgi:ferric-dicitrate binding protein FerR (iron transport regulator)
VLCALGLSIAASAEAKAPTSAVVTAVTGAPQVQRTGESQNAKLKVGQFLYKGDVVRTKEGDLAAIAMVSGVEVRINGNTFFEVGEGGTGEKPASVELNMGQMWTRVMYSRAKIKVNSQVATMSVRGTEADIELQQRLDVRVYEGHVDVGNGKGRQSLSAGQMTSVLSAAEAPQAPRNMSPSDRLSWQDGIAPKDAEGELKKLRKDTSAPTMDFKTKDGKDVKFKLKPKDDAGSNIKPKDDKGFKFKFKPKDRK